jgi:hypothetical protein
MSDSANVSPGWYKRPQNPSQERYWDGSAWTSNVRNTVNIERLSATRPLGRRQSRNRRLFRRYTASGLFVLTVIVAVTIATLASENNSSSESDGKPRGTPISQKLSPTAYKTWEYIEHGHCSIISSNTDTQSSAILDYCRNREDWHVTICGPTPSAPIESTRHCFLNGLNKEAHFNRGSANALSKIVNTLLPGECRSYFQTAENALTAEALLGYSYTPELSSTRNDEKEIRAKHLRYIKSLVPLVRRMSIAVGRIREACRP